MVKALKTPNASLNKAARNPQQNPPKNSWSLPNFRSSRPGGYNMLVIMIVVIVIVIVIVIGMVMVMVIIIITLAYCNYYYYYYLLLSF